MVFVPRMSEPSKEKHNQYMQQALSLADHAPSLPTNFRVGAVLVDTKTGKVLTTGYTMEREGNVHAEQCCLDKLAGQGRTDSTSAADGNDALEDKGLVLYTTVEPCNRRLSGNLPCVDRIIAFRLRDQGISMVYVGALEPETFVGPNTGAGRARLAHAGIETVLLEGWREDALKVATAGHRQETSHEDED